MLKVVVIKKSQKALSPIYLNTLKERLNVSFSYSVGRMNDVYIFKFHMAAFIWVIKG